VLAGNRSVARFQTPNVSHAREGTGKPGILICRRPCAPAGGRAATIRR
jgi:hypothetical protein